jgi:hypothetical protein
VGLLVMGVLLGRFAVPLLEPKDIHGIRVHPAVDHCRVEFSTQTYYLWHKDPAFGDFSDKVMCNTSVGLLPNLAIACVCR